jgi:HTH-type transcriptional regulator/antitoxin HigA
MQSLVKLSLEENSPLIVQDRLKKLGITLIIEPHFAKTRLDGAVLFPDKENPIIGLTLRHDRLDNFWFTLMHELAHIALHYNQDVDFFYDELEEVKGLDIGEMEKEADVLAGEALVPTPKWEVSPARLIPSSLAANSLAKEVGVHVTIIAGKIRHEGGKYFYLNNIVGQATVRRFFPGEKWQE